MRYWITILTLLLSVSTLCQASVSIKEFKHQEFNPSAGKRFAIPVKIGKPGSIKVVIYSSDGDVVRTLSSSYKAKAGTYTLSWDGKDEDKTIVPNEAYIPVAKLYSGKKDKPNFVYDSRNTSGGKEIKINPNLNTQGHIDFTLKRPSRILARAGIKSGPMMKTILDWQVRGSGRNRLAWDGYDQDKMVNLAQHKRLALLVTGFELPDHAIITNGNKSLSYTVWRKTKKWPSVMPDFKKKPLERNGQRISRHYYLPRSVDIEPRVSLALGEKLPLNPDGLPIVTKPISLKVDMHKDDRWAMKQSLYEVAFFLDYEFISEEEQGYVPLTWRWNPAGLKPGIHVISVNVSGFNGQVGVKSVTIFVPKQL